MPSHKCQLELSKWNVIAKNQRAFNQNIYNLYISLYISAIYILTTKLNSSTLSALSRSFSLSLSPTLNIIYQLFCVHFITLTFHTHTHAYLHANLPQTHTHTYTHTHTLSSIDSPILIMFHILLMRFNSSLRFNIKIVSSVKPFCNQSTHTINQKNPQTTTTTTIKTVKNLQQFYQVKLNSQFLYQNYRTIVYYYLYSLYKRFVSFHSVPFCYDVSSRLP